MLNSLTEKHRTDLAAALQNHARDLKVVEDREVANLKDYHDRLAAQEKASLETLKRVQEDAANGDR